ncbi:apolipoprotein N-acyltransferase [Candidatus Njordibacter sp. Uisw_056]|uniref:apolipoprotein N-acyltransferase n=1 Tax=Candidatus Njordibacter sp. Uisw_056 TaxID=3230973 RepID=UPI003D3C190D
MLKLPLKANLAASIIAGAMAPLALAPLNLWPLAPLSVVLFWYTLNHSNHTKNAMVNGLAYGLGYFGVGVSWVFVSMVDHGDTHWLLATVLTVLFCFGLALLYGVFAGLFYRLKHHHQYPSLLFIGLWVSLDLLRAWLLTGFPWLYLGYAGLDTFVAGYAPILGVHGITLLLLFSGLLILGVQVKLHLRLALLAGLWLIGYGLSTISWTQPSQKAPLKVTILQADVKLKDKWSPQTLTPTLGYYFKQSYLHLGSDLIVWPETAIATYWDYIAPAFEPLSTLAKEKNTQIISGTVIRETPKAGANYYNGLVAFGAEDGQYYKQRLVPFGEYVPLESWLRGAINFFDLPMSAFKLPLKEQGLLTQNIAIAGNICYEIAYPQLVAQQAAQAQMILTVSNDTWFEHSLAPWQHLQMAQMRALENRKPVVRATNSGVSALIDASGEITHIAPVYQQAQLTGLVALMEGKTPYNTGLNWPVWLLSVGLILCGLRRNLIGAVPIGLKT